ncbi:7TM-DISM domain-containing protein [Clostridium porci]
MKSIWIRINWKNGLKSQRKLLLRTYTTRLDSVEFFRINPKHSVLSKL